MSTPINRLSAIDGLQAGDMLAFYDSSNGDPRRGSVSLLQSYLEQNWSADTLARQAETPTATGFSIAVSAANTFLLITPAAAYAAGTVVFPATTINGAIIKVVTTKQITSLTVSATGSTVSGMPQSLGANGSFTARYDSITDNWYRVD